jgi:hypothetical protein
MEKIIEGKQGIFPGQVSHARTDGFLSERESHIRQLHRIVLHQAEMILKLTAREADEPERQKRAL